MVRSGRGLIMSKEANRPLGVKAPHGGNSCNAPNRNQSFSTAAAVRSALGSVTP